jgi:chloride channel protein, CIC family
MAPSFPRESLGNAWAALRGRFRSSEAWFIGLALLVGMLAGALTGFQGLLAHSLQRWLYGIEADGRLSLQADVAAVALLALPVGGLLVGLISVWAARLKRPLIDAVEANALHGGRMSMRDNLIVASQTLLSNGSGASVGLEATYTQMGAGTGSQLGRVLRLRRMDMRILVGAGAAGAISAAFGAPLAGAFYAFEVVLGSYSPAALAPIVLASLAGAFIADQTGVQAYLLPAAAISTANAADYAVYSLLGVACGGASVGIMRLIASIETTVKRGHLPLWARPAVGGFLLIPLAMVTPQVLSSGHGALHWDLTTSQPLAWIAALLALKCLASGISLGFGFRGGLFFASLFMGSLLGILYAGLAAMIPGGPVIDPTSAAIAGMAALAAAVVGAPMTMAMLVLEGTHDFVLTSLVMGAVLVANTLVRQQFGYSFSTWRLHLRGETIKSAQDVGWVQNLRAGLMMRRGVPTAPQDLDVATFRERFPLGSGSRVILIDTEGHYAGIVQIAKMYADGVKPSSLLSEFAENPTAVLSSRADVVEVMKLFDQTQSDELAVTDESGHVLGVVSEAFVRKRYAEELDKRQREQQGERVDDLSPQE